MNLCTGTRQVSHEEIVHEGRKCPMCDLIADTDETIEQLKQEVKTLETENDRLAEQ